ncbi:uncharacterized protein LOC135494874 [Lineus longissimus]|uniref:uncharacterized protein LOC135494874 n=1 Tax=Lineus longissimus TaxID=88925 RepID=UPI002B4C8726
MSWKEWSDKFLDNGCMDMSAIYGMDGGLTLWSASGEQITMNEEELKHCISAIDMNDFSHLQVNGVRACSGRKFLFTSEDRVNKCIKGQHKEHGGLFVGVTKSGKCALVGYCSKPFQCRPAYAKFCQLKSDLEGHGF